MAPRFKKIVVASALALGVAGVASAAWAYFTSTGQGTASATTGSASPFTVSSTSDTLGDLVPNASIGSGVIDTISYTVTNGASGSQMLSNVTVSVGGSSGTSPTMTETNWTTGSAPTCNSSDFSVGGQAVGDGVTAGSGAYTAHPDVSLASGAAYHGTFTLQMVDNGANQDSCEGVTVPLFISAS